MSGRHAVRDDASAPFFDAARREELCIQRCGNCGHVESPDARICARCESIALSWIHASGGGSLITWAVVHRPPHPAFADLVPYVAGIIELDEGPWMHARLLGPPRSLQPGASMRVVFLHDEGDESIPAFRLD
jgi:uncharacterized OB-fold protein